MYGYVIEITLGNTVLYRLNPDSLCLGVQSTLMVLLLDQTIPAKQHLLFHMVEVCPDFTHY